MLQQIKDRLKYFASNIKKLQYTKTENVNNRFLFEVPTSFIQSKTK